MRARLAWALAVLALLLAVLIVPPMVSVSRYKSRITQLLSASLGRPVRLSSVEVRLLPRPGFVLTDLSVEDDPAFGAEPILHANAVTASIRLFPLWRGKLEIGNISVDEASLNLVRTTEGRWNLDSFFRSAGKNAGAARALPYLEATNSRINIKNGIEKLPHSLVNTDLSFWQQSSGEWRFNLRGQPARTDLNLQQGDTGTVRMSGSLRKAASLSQMPIHLDMEWREAQLGQLSRLLAGTDPGWRGDLTGELTLDGTAESAQVKSRLRAVGVHRAEFAPVAPLDFDARCNLIYHFNRRGIEGMVCDSPLGDGHIRLSGDLPGDSAAQPRFTVELDRIPVTAGMDALRTVRSDFAPGIAAKGVVSGKIVYSEAAPEQNPEKDGKQALARAHRRAAKAPSAPAGPLTGSFLVEGFQLQGDGLSAPVTVPKIVLEPAAEGDIQGLTATVAIPAGGSAPLSVSTRFTLHGYQFAVHGQAAVARARELAHVLGVPHAALLDAIAGDPLAVDLSAEGAWVPAEKVALLLPSPVQGPATPAAPAGKAPADLLTGTVTLHNINWKADYLANHVVISQAVLHLEPGQTRWDPVAFSYGPVKGTASLTLPATCTPPACAPHFELQFGQLDAAAVQAAVLGAQEKVTLISTLLARLRPAAAPLWPTLEGTVKADSLVLGPATMREASAQVKTTESGAEITAFDASMLGGHVHGTGALTTPRSAQEKPSYSFEGRFEKISPAALGALVDQHWSGGPLEAHGKVELAGFTQQDLAASAKGTLHFDWQRGAASGANLPTELARFDLWSGDAEIAGGAIVLKKNEVKRGAHAASAEASLTLGAGAKLSFPKAAETAAKK